MTESEAKKVFMSIGGYVLKNLESARIIDTLANSDGWKRTPPNPSQLCAPLTLGANKAVNKSNKSARPNKA